MTDSTPVSNDVVCEKVQCNSLEAHDATIPFLKVVNLEVEGKITGNDKSDESSLSGMFLEFALRFPLTAVSTLIIPFLFVLAGFLAYFDLVHQRDPTRTLTCLGAIVGLGLIIKNELRELKNNDNNPPATS